jgi:hypothetical protein
MTVPRAKITRDRIATLSEAAERRPERVREYVRDDLRLFANLVSYRWIEETKREDWYPLPRHADDWHRRFVDDDASPMILAPRKHVKTTWALCELLHDLQFKPGFAALYWCNNADNQLTARMEDLEEMIESNLWLDGLHRGKPDNLNNVPRGLKQKDFPNGSTLYGTGVGSGIEGSHVNAVVGDDPLKEHGGVADSEILDFYLKVIVPMADAADRTVIVGTRKRPKDIYYLIRERTNETGLPGYRLVEYPAVREAWLDNYGDRPEHLASADVYESDPPARPDFAGHVGVETDHPTILWPAARGPEFLLSKLGRQGHAAFLREFCMVFTHVEDAIIKRSWIEDDPVSVEPAGVSWTTPPSRDAAEAFLGEHHDVEGFEFDRVAVGLDPAVAEGGDNCAWCVVAERSFPDMEWPLRYPLHATHFQGIQPERMRQTTADLHDRFEADVIVAERNGLEWYMDRHVQFPTRLPVTMHQTGAGKHSWKRGVPAIADAVERGRWRFIRGSDGVEDLIDALCSLRMDDNDHLAGHTPDVVMAAYMATKGLGSGKGGVVDLGRGDGERVEREAKRERALEGGEIGDALLNVRDERRRNLR